MTVTDILVEPPNPVLVDAERVEHQQALLSPPQNASGSTFSPFDRSSMHALIAPGLPPPMVVMTSRTDISSLILVLLSAISSLLSFVNVLFSVAHYYRGQRI
jgi:hypothetical protein